MNNYEKIFYNQNNYGWATTLNLTNKFPAISKRIFNTLENAQSFIDNYNDSAIEGLILSVVNDTPEKNGAYFVQSVKMTSSDNNGVLTKIGEIDLSDIYKKLTEHNNLISVNKEDIASILSLINFIESSVSGNTQNIIDNKTTIDNYTINNQKISDSPILNTDDLSVTVNFKVGGNIDNIKPDDTLTDAISKLENNLGNIVKIFSASLNHLESEIQNFAINEVTWSELKDLRNEEKLIPGCKYCITDYITTTSKENTQSVGHPFEIIVEALSKNTLSENVQARLCANDEYFIRYNTKPEKWELKYCLDNDTNRFDWADFTNGKGVIYYMKDEWGNEGIFDFKNIKINDKFKFDFYGEDGSLNNKKMILS